MNGRVLSASLALICVSVSFSSSSFALSVKNFREILAYYSNALQVPTVDPNITRSYAAVKSRLPLRGEVGEFSDTALLGYTELAGAFCQIFVNRERGLTATTRIAHQKIDFALQPSKIPSDAMTETFNRYGEIFWERTPDSKEHQVLAESFASLIKSSKDTAQDTPLIMRTLCSTFATSLEALIYK